MPIESIVAAVIFFGIPVVMLVMEEVHDDNARHMRAVRRRLRTRRRAKPAPRTLLSETPAARQALGEMAEAGMVPVDQNGVPRIGYDRLLEYLLVSHTHLSGGQELGDFENSESLYLINWKGVRYALLTGPFGYVIGVYDGLPPEGGMCGIPCHHNDGTSTPIYIPAVDA